jgi:hypothetical protein
VIAANAIVTAKKKATVAADVRTVEGTLAHLRAVRYVTSPRREQPAIDIFWLS